MAGVVAVAGTILTASTESMQQVLLLSFLTIITRNLAEHIALVLLTHMYNSYMPDIQQHKQLLHIYATF